MTSPIPPHQQSRSTPAMAVREGRPRRFADAGRTVLGDLVDLERYPLDAPDSPRFAAVVAGVRASLAEQGCAVLPAFLSPEGLATARREGAELAPKAFFQERLCNVYNSEPEPDLPADDPRRHFMERSSGFVPRDTIPADTALQRLYVSPGMKRLVAACAGLEEVFEYADPFAGLVFNVLPSGTQQPWHYDTNEFVTTIMTQEAERGGEFQYCPQIRRPGDENLDGVGRVLRGQSEDSIRRLALRAGDLQLFKGRYSLHRVTRVAGRRQRHTAVFGYAMEPGVVGPIERTRQLYGRVAEVHLLAERRRRDAWDGLIR